MATVKTAEVKTNDLGETLVKIRLPKTRTEQEPLFVSINERTWLIQRGVEVEVPECVSIILRNREEQIEKNLDKLPND